MCVEKSLVSKDLSNLKPSIGIWNTSGLFPTPLKISGRFPLSECCVCYTYISKYFPILISYDPVGPSKQPDLRIHHIGPSLGTKIQLNPKTLLEQTGRRRSLFDRRGQRCSSS